MKTKKTLFKMLAIAIIVIAFFTGNIYAQGNALWQPLGADTVSTNRNVKTSKSLVVKEHINADSIHTRTIVVGDSSLWVGGTPLPCPPSCSDNIY